ncbi:MAG: hypothetical protein ACK5H1_01170 [Tenacibaculum sp.]
MNNIILNINELPQKELPILSDEEAGQRFRKWSFVNIYSLSAIRDIYIIAEHEENRSVKSITKKVNEDKILKDIEKKWSPFTERQVLENLNALVKFGLLNYDYSIKKKCFRNSKINSVLSEEDKSELEYIFINYFRFKELSSWFISPSSEFHSQFEFLSKNDFITKSKPLYFYSDESRFYNSFLRDIEAPNTKYIIKSDILMRFWDVYLKWGATLGLIDKFNVSRIFNPIKDKEVSMTYFINKFKPIDFMSFISGNFNSRNIWIPELIYRLAKKYRFSVTDIKEFIVHNIDSNDKITFERTSEIFLIKGKTSKKNIREATYLYPLIDDYYISNLIIRK